MLSSYYSDISCNNSNARIYLVPVVKCTLSSETARFIFSLGYWCSGHQFLIGFKAPKPYIWTLMLCQLREEPAAQQVTNTALHSTWGFLRAILRIAEFFNAAKGVECPQAPCKNIWICMCTVTVNDQEMFFALIGEIIGCQ